MTFPTTTTTLKTYCIACPLNTHSLSSSLSLILSLSHNPSRILLYLQVVQVCAEHKKPAKLLKHLAAIKEAGAAMRNPPRVLVFANRIKTVRFVHDAIAKEGCRVVMLHGQRSQAEREEALVAFRSGKSQVRWRSEERCERRSEDRCERIPGVRGSKV